MRGEIGRTHSQKKILDEIKSVREGLRKQVMITKTEYEQTLEKKVDEHFEENVHKVLSDLQDWKYLKE